MKLKCRGIRTEGMALNTVYSGWDAFDLILTFMPCFHRLERERPENRGGSEVLEWSLLGISEEPFGEREILSGKAIRLDTYHAASIVALASFYMKRCWTRAAEFNVSNVDPA